MTRVTTELGSCQVRIETDRPCTHPAVVEIRIVPFRERCVSEQEALGGAAGGLGNASERGRP